jgi:hypothetical protein
VHRPFCGGVEAHRGRKRFASGLFCASTSLRKGRDAQDHQCGQVHRPLCGGVEGHHESYLAGDGPVHRTLCGGVETHVENGRGASALPRKGRDAHSDGQHQLTATIPVHRPFRGRVEAHYTLAAWRPLATHPCIDPSEEGSSRTSGWDSSKCIGPTEERSSRTPGRLIPTTMRRVHWPFRGEVESHRMRRSGIRWSVGASAVPRKGRDALLRRGGQRVQQACIGPSEEGSSRTGVESGSRAAFFVHRPLCGRVEGHS